MARSMLDGEDLQLEGAIFDEYKEALAPAGSLVELPRNIDWSTTRTILAADLGVRCPHALLAYEDLARGAWVVSHEWAPNDADIGDLARMIRRGACPRREWSKGDARVPIDKFVVDPAGLQRSDHDGKTGLDIWALPAPEGIGMMPLIERDVERKSVTEGILRMNLALERRKLLFSRELIEKGKACHKDQRSIAKSMLGYAWDPRNPHKPRKDGFFDHGADCCRYLWREVGWNVNPVPNLYTGRSVKVLSEALAQARDSR